MNSRLIYIFVLSIIFTCFSACDKQDFEPNPENLQGNWIIATPVYTFSYGDDKTITISKENPTISSEEVVLEQEGTYQKSDPNGILVFGGGYLSTTGYGTWGYLDEQKKLYLDRIEYYNYDSEAGNTYIVTNNGEQLSLKSTGILANLDNKQLLLQNYRPFINLGLYNGNSIVQNIDPNDYQAGYEEGEYISYIIGYLRNLVNSNNQVILDNNPYTFYLNSYLDATQAIWNPSVIDNNYLQGVNDGISANTGTAIGNTDFQETTGKTATVFESYELIK